MSEQLKKALEDLLEELEEPTKSAVERVADDYVARLEQLHSERNALLDEVNRASCYSDLLDRNQESVAAAINARSVTQEQVAALEFIGDETKDMIAKLQGQIER